MAVTHADMQAEGTLVSLSKLHLDLLDVICHPVTLLLTLHQLGFELSTKLCLWEKILEY